jgi:hypothetical protein
MVTTTLGVKYEGSLLRFRKTAQGVENGAMFG